MSGPDKNDNVIHLRGLDEAPEKRANPLFGGGRIQTFGKHHYVFDGEAPMVTGPVWIPDEEGNVFKMHGSRHLVERQERPYRPTVLPDDFEAKVTIEPGEDPHVAFYRASIEFREFLAQATERIATEIPEWDANNVDLVTVAFTPIIAVPYEDRGFFLMATCGQFACESGRIVGLHDLYDRTNVDGGEIIHQGGSGQMLSTTGEFPIKAPNNIEMQLLVRLDHEVVTRKVAGNTRDLMMIFKNKVVRVT
jgi:hypothetical protein